MPSSKSVRRSVAMTPEMRARLQQQLDKETRDVTEADLIREAVREYLDRQEDVTGSRAHFRKTFQTRIDTLDDDLRFRLDVLLELVAHGLAVMLPLFVKRSITAGELTQAAIVAAAREQAQLQQQIDVMRDAS